MTPSVPTVQSPHVRFALRRGAMTYDGATPWFATVGVGTPAQTMRMMIDTGTLNTWVTGAACTTMACMAHQRFNPDASLTWRLVHADPHTVDFGPWGTMMVVDGRDVCQLDLVLEGLACSATLQEPITFEVAIHYDGIQFQELDCDGGLAVPSVPDAQATALLEALKAEGKITYRIAAFEGDALVGAGTCFMGAVDPSRFDAATVNVLPLAAPIPGLEYLWCVPLDRLVCAGASLFEGYPFCLDTGSSCFKGSEATMAALRAVVTGSGQRPDVVQDPSQFASFPDLVLSLGGQRYTLHPQDYFVQLGSGVWVLGFQVLYGLPDAFLLVGSLFLDGLYTAFDMEAQAVLLATPLPWPVTPVQTLAGTWQNEFGSLMEVGPIAPDGTFRGVYRSHTGATGAYPVVGVVDPFPLAGGQTVSFSVSWRSTEGAYDPSWHWVSAFAGTLSQVNGKDTLVTQYLLQQDPLAAPSWMGTAVFPSTFTRV